MRFPSRMGGSVAYEAVAEAPRSAPPTYLDVGLALARVGIVSAGSLRGAHISCVGFVRSWFVQIGGAWVVGVWPVAPVSIHKVLTVPVRASGSIRTKDTPACGRVVFWHKRLSFLWVVAATGQAFILSLVR